MKHIVPVVVLALGAAAGCKKNTPPAEAPKAPEAAKPAEPAKAPEPAAEEPKADPAPAPTKANAEGGEVAPTQAATDCPKSLTGTDEVDRTIKSECGTVPVTGDYRVDGGTLTLEAGVTLAFERGAALRVGEFRPAKLIVKGTAEKPVTFTTSRDKVAGEWVGVFLESHAERSSLENAVIEFAGAENQGALTVSAKDSVVKGVKIAQSRGYGLQIASDGTADVSGCTFEGTAAAAVNTTFPASGGIGVNTFPKDEKGIVQVAGGQTLKSMTWRAVGAPWVILDDVRVDGAEGTSATWTIEAGATVRLDADANILVGEFQRGELVAKGTTEGLIHFEPLLGGDPGSWGALRAWSQGKITLENVALSLGGAGDVGMLWFTGDAKISVKNAAFTKPKGPAVVSDSDTARFEAFEGVTITDATPAMQLRAGLLGGLGTGNVYAGTPRIAVDSGVLPPGAQVWKAQKAPVVIRGDLNVDTDLTLEAGGNYVFSDGTTVNVGQFGLGMLTVKGTPEAPVALSGERAEAGGWNGLRVYRQGKLTLEHATISHAADPAVHVAEGGKAKLDDLAGKTTAGVTLAWECGAGVEHTAITSDGPAAEKAPEGCAAP